MPTASEIRVTLLPWRTVRENVTLPLEVGPGRGERPASATADELLSLVGLEAYAGRYPHELSGGQRQRVAIARAFLGHPRILLMDEPFDALDEITRDRLNDELAALWQRTGVTILFVTHSIMEAAYLGQRVLVLAADPGQVREMVDLRPLKGETGRLPREAPVLVEVMAHLRSLLAGQA
jgi:NitT/TauT family transport system ATP-binding protein